jgi:chromosome partitioning protein
MISVSMWRQRRETAGYTNVKRAPYYGLCYTYSKEELPMTHIVTIASEKGGVGKTTIAVNLAARAHQRGLKTLLVDLDQQCSASFASIGNVDSIRDASKSVIELWDEDVEPTFIDSEFGFSLLKSCSQMDSVDDDLPAAKVALSRLKNYGFDCIIIDSPPAAGVRQFAAIQMSDVYLIPTTLDRISLFSFADTVSHFYDMHRPTKADISLYAVFNMHLATSASQKKVISTLREQLSIVMDEV